MNQILFSDENINNNKIKIHTSSRQKATFNLFKFQFIFCLISAIIITGYYCYLQYDKKQKENISKDIIRNLSITNLYENTNNNYIASRATNEGIYNADSRSFNVIGIIEIKTIGIYYPIINEFSYELLKIAPCKFLGPNPNEVGNLCIAGHNYNNYQFFSRLKKLNTGDIITIYDLNRNKN